MKDKNYVNFVTQIKERIRAAQYQALKAVNKELIKLYQDIGKDIVEQQQKYGWGLSIVESLASDLQQEYPEIKGFSSRNLWNMRTFYLMIQEDQKLQPLAAEISWVKNVIIMEKCKDSSERVFYLTKTKEFGWTKNILIHQIESGAYTKFLTNQTNFGKSIVSKYKKQAKLAVKDEYTFDFLELGEEHSERELELSLLAQIKQFLSELGDYFCFVASQYRIEINGSEFFIDLLLYHRKLQCLVAIDLKIGNFIPEYAGKMQFYLSVLDKNVKLRGENPSIGIIICKSKDRTIVEYALKEAKKPMGVSTYKITPSLPKKLVDYLPTQKQISGTLQNMKKVMKK